MFEFHADKSTYFSYQYRTSKEYIIPFIEERHQLHPDQKVLEIGCAEAGVLKAFLERGHKCVGIELSPSRVKLANEFLKEEIESGQAEIIARNIYDIDVDKYLDFRFDIIILKDVIEHIHDQDRFIHKLGDFLTPQGKVFFGFPPWQMPFGGHQQLFKSKILSKTPYFHLLPRPLYKKILEAFGESELKVNNLLEIKDTGISIERFERILRKEQYQITRKNFFLVNPIYKYKFGLTPRDQLTVISSMPVLRNFLSTCAYYLIEKS